MAGKVSGGLVWLDPADPDPLFPDPETAMLKPNGLLAAGGGLSSRFLLKAYAKGVFPWYDDGQPILWWSPDPRAVIECGQVHISRSLRRLMRSGRFEVSVNEDCAAVIEACARPREPEVGTWITPRMKQAYQRMHQLGHVHSVEIWEGGRLAGGLYGLAMGAVFCGESMFSAVSGASKVALAFLDRLLCDSGFKLIDCQMGTPHLRSMGARLWRRGDFLARFKSLSKVEIKSPPWSVARRKANDPALNRR